MSNLVFRRIERKFYIDKEQFNKLINKIGNVLVLDEYSLDNGYNVNSVYFDNKNEMLIHRSIMKPYFKEKLRLRYYNNETFFLEIKRKIGKIITKRRIKFTNEEYQKFIFDGSIPSHYSSNEIQIANEIKYLINKYNAMPRYYINYDRIAYYHKDDKDFRITFDHNIKYKEKENDVILSKGELVPDDEYVMEVKFCGALPIWFVNVLTELGIVKRAFSKCGQAYKHKLKGELSYVY